ncbi:hypothetical protein MRX96_048342 [Rhipicephalus microplus]
MQPSRRTCPLGVTLRLYSLTGVAFGKAAAASWSPRYDFRKKRPASGADLGGVVLTNREGLYVIIAALCAFIRECASMTGYSFTLRAD